MGGRAKCREHVNERGNETRGEKMVKDRGAYLPC